MKTTAPGAVAATSSVLHDFLWNYGSDLVITASGSWRSFVKQLGFSQEQAFITFGAFAALVYGLISIGGYVGDHLLGTKRTLVLGAVVLALGYFMTGLSLT